MPYLARIISSDIVRSTKHFVAESKCKLRGKWPTLEVYLHPGDPYSQLLLQVLPNLKSRFAIDIQLFWMDKLEEQMFPEPTLLRDYGLKDSQYLASCYQLSPPLAIQMSAEQEHEAVCLLQDIADAKDRDTSATVHDSWALLKYIASRQNNLSDAKSCSERINQNTQRQRKLGHYGPGMIYFAGEWYWALDRLAHLEQRLIRIGLAKNHEQASFNTHLQIPEPAQNLLKNKTVTLYWSARSPYSYLALLRLNDLANNHGFTLDIKPIMPMVMRNLAVPKAKKMYIFKDTKREASHYDIPYGFVADPLGEAVLRCYSLLNYARDNSRYIEFLISFSQSVNAQGIRAETDKGMKLIVEGAGLNWQEAKKHLNSEAWKQETAENLQQMMNKGLWGVPSIEYENQIVWGQDRIPFIMQLMTGAKAG